MSQEHIRSGNGKPPRIGAVRRFIGVLTSVLQSCAISVTFLSMPAPVTPAGAQSPEPAAMRPMPRPCIRQPEAVERAVWQSDLKVKRVWGYVDRHSVVPGEPFDVMLSLGSGLDPIRGWIEVFRIGSVGGTDRALVWKSPALAIACQAVSNTAAAIGPNWLPAIEDLPTAGWRPGYYTIDFVEDVTGIRDIDVAYIVVTNPSQSGDVLLKLSTNTYQAYNAWGGHSFYGSAFVGASGQMVSFDRPSPRAFFEYEYFLVAWLEALAARAGFTVDYATNFDLHRDGSWSPRYKLVISGAHDEYWSREEFQRTHDRIFKHGRNTIFLGANAAYFQIRYADINRPPDGADMGRQMVAYKSLNDPIRRRQSREDPNSLVTARFRDGARMPETMLMGVGVEGWFTPRTDSDPKYPYVVARLDAPFFAGTGLKIGDRIGDIVGYEWDSTDPEGDGRRLWDGGRSLIGSIDPSSIKVLFTGEPMTSDGKQGRAEAVYFVSPAGAKVFSSGSIRWSWGLGKPGFEETAVKAFTENLVRHLLSD